MGGSSLARFLAKYRRVKKPMILPELPTREILAWADDHIRRTGLRPTHLSGRMLAPPHKTWGAVELALRQGLRGLPGGDSLYRLLLRRGRSAKDRRGTPPRSDLLKAKNSRRASRREKKRS
jgi:hypothetical protein